MTISASLAANLIDPSLLRAAGLVGGKWFEKATDGGQFDVVDPATGEHLATLPNMSAAETRSAIDAAYAARPAWARKTGKERSAVLRRWHDLMLANTEDLALILATEMGKPLAEAKGEIVYAAAFLEWFAEEAKRIYGETIPAHQADKRIVVIKQPVGVVGTITPWNFPSAMITRKIAPALAVGCAVVAKPSELTPLSAIALAVLSERAGLPAGLFNIIVGTDSASIGQELSANSKVRKISFTGSTEVGRILMRQGAGQIKKLSLELGGNAPFIVFDDADIDAAVDGAIVAKFRNSGQTCVCANRLYVQAGVHDAFAARLAARVAQLKVGNAFEPGVSIGPLINAKALDKVERHIADAMAHGAKVVTGGNRHQLGGSFFQPTVLTNVTTDMLLTREETFGPVAPLSRFKTAEDVIRLANDTEFGLAAYFYSRDIGQVWHVAEALECGMVGINTGLISTEVAPFGGIKQSGIGREGSRHGADDYMELKYLCFGGIP